MHNALFDAIMFAHNTHSLGTRVFHWGVKNEGESPVCARVAKGNWHCASGKLVGSGIGTKWKGECKDIHCICFSEEVIVVRFEYAHFI